MVDDGGENFVFWFSKTREIALMRFQIILFLCHKAETLTGHGTPGLPGCVGPGKDFCFRRY